MLNKNAYMVEYRKKNPEMMAETQRRHRKRTREKALNKLGNKCSRCGFSDERALQVDHINGGGTKEARRISSLGIFKRVLKHPEDYQLLCANCNWIKRVENNEYQ
jgi:hypothetical protein